MTLVLNRMVCSSAAWYLPYINVLKIIYDNTLYVYLIYKHLIVYHFISYYDKKNLATFHLIIMTDETKHKFIRRNYMNSTKVSFRKMKEKLITICIVALVGLGFMFITTTVVLCKTGIFVIKNNYNRQKKYLFTLEKIFVY